MIVTAATPGGLMNACLDAIQRMPVPGADPATVATAPPCGGTALPEPAARPAAVVSPLSGTLARQAYQAQEAAVQRAQAGG